MIGLELTSTGDFSQVARKCGDVFIWQALVGAFSPEGPLVTTGDGESSGLAPSGFSFQFSNVSVLAIIPKE
jgi:hypothetical protein